jgi:hypothetical protein
MRRSARMSMDDDTPAVVLAGGDRRCRVDDELTITALNGI